MDIPFVLKLLFLLISIGLFYFYLKPPYSRHKRNILKSKTILQKIHSFAHAGQKMNYLRKIDPFVFEELLLTAFEKKGYSIIRNRKYTGDGGIDGLIFDKDGNKVLIQAKRYTSYINPRHLDEFQVLVNNSNAIQGKFVHTGKTGKQTYSSYKNTNIDIISGSRLLDLINTL